MPEIHIYILIYISILMLSLFEIFIKWDSKIYHTVYVILWLFLALFAGTRVCTGGDWFGYGYMFKGESDGPFKLVSDFGGEPLFRLVMYVSYNLGLEFKHFLLIIALATSYLIAKSFYRINPKRIFLLTLLYYSVAFFNQQFGLMRSGLAAALYIYGVSYLLRGSKAKFVVSGILSFFIHTSSVVPFVLAYVFSKRRLSAIFIIPILAFSIFANFYFKNSLFAALEFIVRISGSHFIDYFDMGDRYTGVGNVINTAYLVSLFTFVYLLNLYGRNIPLFATKKDIIIQRDTSLPVAGRPNKSKNIPSIFVNMAGIFVAVNIAMPFPGVVPRLNLYLLMPVWIFMLYVTTSSSRYVSLALNFVIVVYAFAAVFQLISTPDLFEYHKYQSWLIDPSLKWEECISSAGQVVF